MISVAKFRRILVEEARRAVDEAAAHDEDFIAQAYSGAAASTGPVGSPPSDDDSDGEDLSTDDIGSPDEETGSGEGGEEPDHAERVREGLGTRFRDSRIIDFGLDILGTVGGWIADASVVATGGLDAPVAYTLAAVPDLLNSMRHAARGESFDAAVYFLCALPIIGDVLGPARISVKLFGSARRAEDVSKMIIQIRKLSKSAKTAKLTSGVVSKIKEVCNEHVPGFDVDAVADDARVILRGSEDEVNDLISRSRVKEKESVDDEEPSSSSLALAELRRKR